MDRRAGRARRARIVAKTPRGRRRHRLGIVRPTATYSVAEIVALLNVHPNTVLGWIKRGLEVIDTVHPRLVLGVTLKAFLTEQRRSRRRPCAAGEMYCLSCRTPRRPVSSSLTILERGVHQVMIRGVCEHCGTGMNRSGAAGRLEEYRAEFGLSEGRRETLMQRELSPLNCGFGD